jgi:hypothetical protein
VSNRNVEARAETEAFLNNAPGLRQHVSDSPLGMKLDCYEWILFLTAHSERHLKQILEVKADPGFPKGKHRPDVTGVRTEPGPSCKDLKKNTARRKPAMSR